MKKNYTHISIVLDKSGSMQSCVNDTIGGFNQFLKTQREAKGTATVTLVQFNDYSDVILDMKPLSDIEELSTKNYNPNGNTALLDAIGKTINNVESKINEMPKKSKPEKVIFVVITDGEENASVEFKKPQIMEMINNHRSEQKWEFVFIGANQDAIQAGSSIGVRAGSTLNYTQDSRGIKAMYCSLSRGMTSYRSKSVDEAIGADFFVPQSPDDDDDKKID